MSSESAGHETSFHPARGDEPTVVQLIVMLLRQRRLIARVAMVVVMATVTATLLQRRTFSSIVSFVPNSAELPQGSVAGLAAQFGFAIPSGLAGQSPEFYAELLESRALLIDAVATEYSFPAMSGLPFARDTVTIAGDLSEILEIDETPRERAHEKAVQELRDMTSIGIGRQSGTVTVTVTTHWPELSMLLAERILALVDQFNRTSRQSQAAAERRFVEERLAQTRAELRAAEDRMEKFLSDNRTFAGSPQLVFQNDRLAREVTLRQQIVTGLAQSHEKARIDEVRNTPVVTVVEQPEAPMLPDKRRLALKGLLALMGGLLVGAIAGFTREMFLSGRDTDAGSFEELRVLRAATLRELRRPWRLVSRRPATE